MCVGACICIFAATDHCNLHKRIKKNKKLMHVSTADAWNCFVLVLNQAKLEIVLNPVSVTQSHSLLGRS